MENVKPKSSKTATSQRNRKKSKRRRAMPKARKGSVRLPKDYPWKVANRLLADVTEYMAPASSALVESIIRTRDIDRLMQLSKDWGLQCIPSDSGDRPHYEVELELLFGALLKKFPFEGASSSRVDVAMEKFLQSEAVCSEFNRTKYKRLLEPDGLTPTRMLAHCTDFISRVLGPLDEDKVMLWCRHGPGSSTSSTRGNVCTYFKYGEWPYHVTADAASHAKRLIQSDQRWLGALEDSYRERYCIEKYMILNQEEFWRSVFTIVDGNRITTVPKDYHTDRPIAIEPTMNLMLQLGVDGYIRRRLRRWGINLNSQWRNQALAREGSIGCHADKPATLDLSNASDSVSLRIVKLMFPRDWYEYVTSIRSPKGVLPTGASLRYSKLSSMGNGATFAIESLVFAAICYAASREIFGFYKRDSIVVYGDDIVVPESMALITSHYLEHCGFSINREKSFFEGSVKESCGTDWIHGRMVRPVFLKKMPADVCELFAHRNLLVRWANQHLGVDLPKTTELFLSWIPEPLRLWGPVDEEEFSGYLHTPNPGVFKRQHYEFKSAVKLPIPQHGSQFLFRKLMAVLKEYPQPDYEDIMSKKSSVSSAFVVTARGRLRFSVVRRICTEWNTSYQAPGATHLRSKR